MAGDALAKQSPPVEGLRSGNGRPQVDLLRRLLHYAFACSAAGLRC